jgi:Tol biopolymer transport system component
LLGRSNVLIGALRVLTVVVVIVGAAIAPALGGSFSPTRVHDGISLASAPGANGRIVFARSPYNDLPNRLWSMASGGSDQQQLTPGGSGWGDVEPAYSPGGTMIAFARDQADDDDAMFGDIFVMQANGTGIKRLTATSTGDSYPDWTPDGSRIVFFSYRTGNGDIYSMKIDGTDVRRLTTNAAVDSYPSVSPDGKRIAFASDRTGGAFDIYTMSMDGSGVTRLTTAQGHDFEPDWSPDGAKIVFSSASGPDGDYEIMSMNANGSNQVNLTDDPSKRDFEPSWSPDGSQIAFQADDAVDGTDVNVMDSTGGTQTAVGATENDESGPDWQPIPEFPLVDARFSTFNADIQWVYNEGITVGCSAERYCPTDPVTREQMAIFLDRALDLPATATDYFSDDTGRTGEAAINRVAAAGITTGCAAGKYCPTDKVTRGAMASFLARAFDLPATATDYFSDDAGTTHEQNINRVAAAGITSGCTPTTYCPAADVTRGQMAAFLRRALE